MMRRHFLPLLSAAAVAVSGLVVPAVAHAAGESVNIWLTTTDGGGGRNVTRGLEQQGPVSFAPGPVTDSRRSRSTTRRPTSSSRGVVRDSRIRLGG